MSRCIFDHNQHGLGSSFNHNWVAITRVLDSISLTLFCISTVEFFASQTSYLMRGLIFGVGYGSMFIIGYGIYWPFIHLSITWGTGIFSCEFWYLLLALLMIIVFSGLLLVVVSGTRTERERMCYQMNTSLLRDTMHNHNDSFIHFNYSV